MLNRPVAVWPVSRGGCYVAEAVLPCMERRTLGSGKTEASVLLYREGLYYNKASYSSTS